MKKYIFLVIVLITQALIGMAPQVPTIHNRTIKVPTHGSITTSYYVPLMDSLGPVIGGIPPYRYHKSGATGFTVNLQQDGTFWAAPNTLPASFQYYVEDSLGLISPPATVTLEPGSPAQDETEGLLEAESG